MTPLTNYILTFSFLVTIVAISKFEYFLINVSQIMLSIIYCSLLAVSVIVVFCIIKFVFHKNKTINPSESYKLLELTIAIVGLVFVIFGAKSTADQYWNDKQIYRESQEKQRIGNNYDRVVSYYLKDNLDLFLKEFQIYTEEILDELNRLSGPYENLSDEEKNKIYQNVFNELPDYFGSVRRLNDFGHPTLKACNGVIHDFDSVLLQVTHENISKREIKKLEKELETEADFIFFNLDEIGKLIRENDTKYEKSNISSVMNMREYQEIQNRFINLVHLANNVRFSEGEDVNKNRDYMLQYMKTILKEKNPTSLIYNKNLLK